MLAKGPERGGHICPACMLGALCSIPSTPGYNDVRERSPRDKSAEKCSVARVMKDWAHSM